MTLVNINIGEKSLFRQDGSLFSECEVTIRHKYQMACCLILAPQIMKMFN